MLSLNLISQETKQEIKLRRVYGVIKKIHHSLIIAAMTAATALLMAKIILQNNFNEIVEQTTLVTKNSQAYNNKIKEINTRLNIVDKIQKDFIAYSFILEDLAAKTPKGVVLSFAKLDGDGAMIKIKGQADSRDNLLALKKNMEGSTTFKDIEFPLANILKQKNIDFEISAKLNFDKKL